jgi:hypothetical protein
VVLVPDVAGRAAPARLAVDCTGSILPDPDEPTASQLGIPDRCSTLSSRRRMRAVRTTQASAERTA